MSPIAWVSVVATLDAVIIAVVIFAANRQGYQAGKEIGASRERVRLLARAHELNSDTVQEAALKAALINFIANDLIPVGQEPPRQIVP